jgi:hypothetical protein
VKILEINETGKGDEACGVGKGDFREGMQSWSGGGVGSRSDPGSAKGLRLQGDWQKLEWLEPSGAQ